MRLAAAFLLLAACGTARADDAARDPATVHVCLQPLGKHDEPMLAPLARGITHVYGFTVTTLEARAMPEDAWYAPRKRWRADKILDALPAIDGCRVVLAVTSEDISHENDAGNDWGILGLAYLDQPVAVVSSFRVKRKAKLARQTQRLVKVALHELGHTFGLEHRAKAGKGCIMNDANGTIKTVDRERGTLCADERDAIEAKLDVTLPVVEQLDWTWIQKGD